MRVRCDTLSFAHAGNHGASLRQSRTIERGNALARQIASTTLGSVQELMHTTY